MRCMTSVLYDQSMYMQHPPTVRSHTWRFATTSPVCTNERKQAIRDKIFQQHATQILPSNASELDWKQRPTAVRAIHVRGMGEE
jgi:hypothetical protein